MKIKLTIKQHNKLFKYRKVKIFTYYEIIDDPKNRDIEMYEYIRLPFRVLAVILSPLAIIIGGYPSVINLIKECINKNKVGADTVNRDWLYKQLEVIRNE